MKIYTSYFYQVRFFPKNLIPLSTAIADPKWYHAGHGKDYKFKDKRGVINGLRAEPFYPRMEQFGSAAQCRGPENCPYKNQNLKCGFLLGYTAQLNQLNFSEIMERFHKMADAIKAREGYEDIDFALLLHEAPNNPCSERWSIQEWFARNGLQVTEWVKPTNDLKT